MSGDYSRERFDPHKGYEGVLMQQGRVQVDADWNEQVKITQRRMRVSALDTFGTCSIPSEFPDSFKIHLKNGKLFVNSGRAYVDGLLVENHGLVRESGEAYKLLSNINHSYMGLGVSPSDVERFRKIAIKVAGGSAQASDFDPVLEEKKRPKELAVSKQPYRLDNFSKSKEFSPPLMGTKAIYLDVWQRELTHISDPSLVENAIGVDTTTRFQTVWQIRSIESPEGKSTCRLPLSAYPGWSSKHPESLARLSTSYAPVADVDNLCSLNPESGYQGLENQFYRVEVHTGGDLDQASLKWSRENKSIFARVLEAADQGGTRYKNGLVVSSLGKDGFLRFEKGDWVEITSRAREYEMRSGQLNLVEFANPTTNTIYFKDPIETDLLEGLQSPVNETSVHKWDGYIKTEDLKKAVSNKEAIFLEKGIAITLTLPKGGEFRSLEYWTFAARVIDGSVEELDHEPPKGIHHHFCKLAVIDSKGNVTDCRSVSSGGCCSIVVRPGGDIQNAIDSLPSSGGCVCLKAGIHLINQPLRISRSNIAIRAESLGSQIVLTKGVRAIAIAHPTSRIENITLQGFSLIIEGIPNKDSEYFAIVADQVDNLRLQNCLLLLKEPMGGVTSAMVTGECRDLLIEGNIVSQFAAGIYCKRSFGSFNIASNHFEGLKIISKTGETSGPRELFVSVTSYLSSSDSSESAGSTDDLTVLRALPMRHPGEYSGAMGRFAESNTSAPATMAARIERVEEGIYVSKVGIEVEFVKGFARIRDNHFKGFGHSITVMGGSGSLVKGNIIFPNNHNQWAKKEEHDYSIRISANHTRILGNQILLSRGWQGGILCTQSRCSIEGNTIGSSFEAEVIGVLPVGIAVKHNISFTYSNAIFENKLIGLQLPVLLEKCRKLSFDRNTIEGASSENYPTNWHPAMLVGVGCKSMSDFQVRGNRIEGCFSGILALNTSTFLAENTFAQCGLGFSSGSDESSIGRELRIKECHFRDMQIGGILAIQFDLVSVTNSHFSQIGGSGVATLKVLKASVEGCEIVDVGTQNEIAERKAVIMLGVLEVSIKGNKIQLQGGFNPSGDSFDQIAVELSGFFRTNIRVATTEGTGPRELTEGIVPTEVVNTTDTINPRSEGSSDSEVSRNTMAYLVQEGYEGSVQILNNHFSGSSKTDLVRTIIYGFRNFIFSNNYCFQTGFKHQGAPHATVNFTANHVNIANNIVKCLSLEHMSVNINSRTQANMIGNLTTGEIKPLGQSQKNLNAKVLI
jgi:hypothetical protein